MTSANAKWSVRETVRAARSRRTPQQRAADTESLRVLATQCETEIVAAFVPLRGEPGDVSVLDALSIGRRVLLPVTGIAGAALQWGWYAGAGSITAGPFGILQPKIEPGLDVVVADLVLVPALALTHEGARLGQGSGYYDRSILSLPTNRLVGVAHDDEVYDALPTEPHDVFVGWICTPSGVRRCRA